MESCIIFCAAGFDALAEPVKAGDHIIAADGGFAHLEALGLRAHEVLGDFDSLGFVPEGATVFPVEKDDTDAMLAVRRGLEQGYRRFVLYGGLDGSRVDHTVANFQTLQFLADRGCRGYLVGKDQIATVIRDGALHFPAGAKGTVSVFCLGADARGVDLTGMKYPLENGTLCAGFPLGVSNAFSGGPAAVKVTRGSLLVIFDRENGIGQEV